MYDFLFDIIILKRYELDLILLKIQRKTKKIPSK